MAKLHEVVAVEGDLSGTSHKIIEEAIVTFSKKPDHFIETATEQKYMADGQENLDTQESKAMVTTVAEKLLYVAPAVSRYLDTYLQKEATNQKARADLVIDDVVLMEAVPATVLLGLETKLKELRALYDSIPTLAPGPHWEYDASRRVGVYRARDPEVRFVTKREMRPVVMSPATKEHPAQVQAFQEDVPVAKKTINTWSGMLSPADKSDLLAKVDKVIRGAKRARQRANTETAVDQRKLGRAIFDYIHDGIIA